MTNPIKVHGHYLHSGNMSAYPGEHTITRSIADYSGIKFVATEEKSSVHVGTHIDFSDHVLGLPPELRHPLPIFDMPTLVIFQRQDQISLDDLILKNIKLQDLKSFEASGNFGYGVGLIIVTGNYRNWETQSYLDFKPQFDEDNFDWLRTRTLDSSLRVLGFDGYVPPQLTKDLFTKTSTSPIILNCFNPEPFISRIGENPQKYRKAFDPTYKGKHASKFGSVFNVRTDISPVDSYKDGSRVTVTLAKPKFLSPRASARVVA